MKQGRSVGWLFKAKGRRAKVSDFDDKFLEAIERVSMERPNLFSKAIMLEPFLLRRSMRRGAVLETTGRVDDAVVNLMNRWRTKEHARGAEPGLNMRQTYTSIKDAFPQLKLYSKAL